MTTEDKKIKELVEELGLLKKDKPQDIERIENLVDSILNAYRLDKYHDIKRALSFEFLDMLIEECNNGSCPAYSLDEDSWKAIWYCLIDISVEGYINQRAYFYSRDKIGIDDIHRFDVAKSRIDKILNCEGNFILPKHMFSFDNTALRDPHIYGRAKERKAYWASMKHNPKNKLDSFRDYTSACELLKTIDNLFHERMHYPKEKLKNLWGENFHIINGVELYKYCILRQ